MHGIAIGGILPQLAHERADEPRSKMVNAIVVVAELGKLAFGLIVGHEPGFVADHSNFRVTDRRQAVGNNRHSRHAEGHRSQRSIVMQRHLNALIGILVVHVVNDVHGIDVDAGKPVHHLFELVDNIVEVEVLALRRRRLAGPPARR